MEQVETRSAAANEEKKLNTWRDTKNLHMVEGTTLKVIYNQKS